MIGAQIWKAIMVNNMVKWPAPLSRYHAGTSGGQSYNYYQHIDRLTSEGVRFP